MTVTNELTLKQTEICHSTAYEVGTLLERNCKEETVLRLNFENITYIDSSGISVLFKCHQTLKKMGGQLILVKPNEIIMDIFKVLNLSKVIQIEH